MSKTCVIKCIILFSVGLGVIGCADSHSTRPNVVVVAVEGLGFNRVLCDDEEGRLDGFSMMCEESIRFTHAYGNSTTSLANMASILTAKLPEDHGLRGQSQWLRPSQFLVSEQARLQGYRTAFFSGGPPVFSKSGLTQGFEIFEDRVSLMQRPYYRAAQRTTELFLNWVNDEAMGEPFFSVVYLPDLLYPFVPSVSRDGELKERSVDSKFSDVAEGLKGLIDFFKDQGLWNRSYVIVVGLQGGNDPMVLRSEQTQLALLIKPPRVQRDQATQWGVDHNVSLVDVGATLFEIFGKRMEALGRSESTSLSSVFVKPEPKWARDRWIHTESYWGFELFGLDIATSVRKDHLFYVNGPEAVLYNTLTDRLEANPSKLSPQSEVWAQLGAPLKNTQVPKWFQLGKQFFRNGDADLDWRVWNHPFTNGWRVRSYIENQRWFDLAEFSEEIQRLDLEILAKSKMALKLPRVHRNSCEAIFTAKLAEPSLEQARDLCKAERLLFYLDWAKAKGSDGELFYENRFRKSFQNWWSRLELGAINYANQGLLGLPLTWPLIPDLSETYLLFREKHSRRFLIETKDAF